MIRQCMHRVDDAAHKRRLLSHYLQDGALTQAVIFTATKRGAAKLAKALSGLGHTSAALHGDMNQNQRKRAVERMRRGEFRLLVATDVAARGLDIKGISHVINFDLPHVAEDYIHRIGRTGRAGATGVAISLVGPEDRSSLADIERLTGNRLAREVIAGLEPAMPEPRANQEHNGHRQKSKGQNRDKTRSDNPRRYDNRQAQKKAPRDNRQQKQARTGRNKPAAFAQCCQERVLPLLG